MNIRKANERDIAGINALLYQVHRIHAEGRPDIFRLGNKKYNDEELCAIIADDTTPIFVAVNEEEKVLGYAFCIYQETKGNPSLCDRKTVYIDDLCVDATERGQHIGIYTCRQYHIRHLLFSIIGIQRLPCVRGAVICEKLAND